MASYLVSYVTMTVIDKEKDHRSLGFLIRPIPTGVISMSKNPQEINRRDLLKTSALALSGSFLFSKAAEAYPKGVNTNSRPSDLRITDLRFATIVKPGPSPCSIIRIDTNQGVYGLGEVRDGASPTYAL